MTKHRAGALQPDRGSEIAAWIREADWASTPLGPVKTWPPSLQIAVSMIHAARQPMLLFWGQKPLCLMNEAARTLRGPSPPTGPVAPAEEAWPECWERLGDDVRRVFAGAPAAWHDEWLLPCVRAGRTADLRFTLSCSPVPDAAAPSGVGGVIALCVEATPAILGGDSEARFHEIANAAPVMIWVADATRACTWLNDDWLRFTGRTLEAERGSGWRDNIHPDDAERVLATYAEAFERRRPFRLDFRLRRHNGQWRVVDNTGAPRFTGDGVFSGFVGSCIDVTRQRETEARFRGVFNAELMGMTVFDANTGDTLAINDYFLRMTGYDRADVDEGRWRREALTPPEQAPLDALAIAQARQRGWWDPYETALRRRDGSTFPARVSSAPLPGQPGRVVIAVQDITVERAAQSALIASEERLRLGLEAGRMVTWEFDLQTGELSQSANSETIFGPGLRPEDYTLRMPAEDYASDQERLQRALASPDGLYQSEFRYQHPDGRLMHLQNWGQVVRDTSGAAVRVHGVCMDITERKAAENALVLLNETLEQQVETRTEELLQAEAALRQAQKMEALGHLTGGVAHDFNNLLGAMVGSFELIRRKFDDKGRVRMLAEGGLRVAERGAKLTKQLLTFSRAERMELRPVSADTVIDGMREMLRRALGPLITVEFDVRTEGRFVLSDPTQLEMAVLNLAINARDAMADGGQLTVAARACVVERDPALASGEYVELLVRDTGTGMSAAVAARAFDPFFTTKGVGKGTGLGLSQVYGIARQAGGAVRIESRLGAGTTIRMLLPCTEQRPALEEPAQSAAEHRRPGATVLLVDDDPDLRAVLAASLEDLGHVVLEAADGADGIALLREHRPDLMVADFAMPGMTGAELAQSARRLQPDLPIIFASGHADVLAIGSAAGPAPRVLHKPFRISELQAAIEAALSSTGSSI